MVISVCIFEIAVSRIYITISGSQDQSTAMPSFAPGEHIDEQRATLSLSRGAFLAHPQALFTALEVTVIIK